MCIKLKRLSAMLAIVLVIFSVSLVPCYAEDSQGADMYLYLDVKNTDPYQSSDAYPVPLYEWRKLFGHTFTASVDQYVGLYSSTFEPLSVDGDAIQPTVYWAYFAQGIIGSTSAAAPAWTGKTSPVGYAYFEDGNRTSISAEWVNNALVGDLGRQLVLRTTLPHGTVRWYFDATAAAGACGFKCISSHSYDFGFAFAYVVMADDDTIALLDEIIALLGSIDTELDTQTELLNDIIQYVNSMDHLLNDIGQNVFGIYDLLKNALADESTELSDAASQLGDQLLQKADSEQYWNDKSDEAFEDLGLSDFSFPDDTKGAFSLVGQIFQQMWQLVGSSGVIFIWTFPLMLGIALTVLGRIARSGGGKKDKGDDSDG